MEPTKGLPNRIRVVDGDGAWAYVGKKSTHVFIWRKGQPTLSDRITESQLRKAMGLKSK